VPESAKKQWKLRRVLIGAILLFFAHQQLHLEPATVALAANSNPSATG
jgi:hypothetical protein